MAHWSHNMAQCFFTYHVSPSGGHVSGQISSVMEQLIVLEKLLSGVVGLHALRTDEALKHRSTTSDTSKIVSSCNTNYDKCIIPQMSDHGSGLCWVGPTLRSETPPFQESGGGEES